MLLNKKQNQSASAQKLGGIQMAVKVEKIEKNIVKLEIEVSNEIFEQAMEKSYRKNVKYINLPGFRKGKAPRKFIEKTYGEAVFYEDAINFACPDAYEKAIEEAGIIAVSQPEIDIVKIGNGENFVFSATVTVKPEFEVSEYKGIKVEKIDTRVLVKDVNAEIDRMREQNARLVTVEDRAIKKGDIAVIDYEGFVDGVAFLGGKDENHNLEIGSGQFIPGFEDQLIGKKTGADVEVKVTFPEEYHAEELKGKDAVFKVKVNAIKAKELPKADDEFAKDVSDFETLAELSADIKAKLSEAAKTRAKRETEDKIVEAIAEKTEIEIPDCMVETQIDRMLDDYNYRLSSQGLSLEQYLQFTGMTMENIREQFKESAYKSVKWNLILEKIAEIEKIEATEEEVEEQLKTIAEQYKMEVDKVRSIMGASLSNLENEIKTNKTLDFLVDNASIEKKSSKKGVKKDESSADGSGADE